ncbi:putative glycolipid-binding domain-containing protein, partial [bacterium]|nr:putative glycolipid-binding domain-containing protein [bacterium]
MEREVMWVSLDEQKFEHLRLVSNKDGVLADGFMIHLNQNNSFRLRYRIHCEATWQVRKVEISRMDKNGPSLVLNSNGKERWTNARGEIIPSLEGCSDVDIFYSPFTNTLAIRRLA